MTRRSTTRRPVPRPTSGSSGTRETRVARIVGAYLDKVNQGDSPDIGEIVRKHPDLAEELKESFRLVHDLDIALEPATPGRILGDYRLLRKLGGGMSVVYEALQVSLQRKVALKLLPSSLLKNPRAISRFLREAEVASRLEHPGICPVYEAGIHEGTPFMAMRFLEGRTLAERISARQPTMRWSTPATAALIGSGDRDEEDRRQDAAAPSPAEIRSRLQIIESTARALHAAHEAGLVHRDVKPGNIMITKYGLPVVLDFGLALEIEGGPKRLTRTGELLGTPPYMSPEQISGKKILLDPRTDVYSLGVTLYECVTSRLPFDAPTLDSLYHRILDSDPPRPRRLNPRISKDLEAILDTALQKDPNRRYQTALEMAEDLRRLQEHKPLHVRRSGPVVRSVRWARRKPALAVSCIVILLLLLSTGALLRKHQSDLGAERLRRYSEGVRNAVMLFHLGSPRRTGPAASQRGPLPAHEGLFPEIHAAERAVDRVRPVDPLKRVVDDLAALALESPERPEAYYHRARALLRLDRLDEALESADEALSRDPGFVPARTLRGVIIERMGRTGEDSAAPSEDRVPTAGSYGRTAWAAAWLAAHRAGARRQWRDAIEAYSTLIDLDPGGEETHFGLSMEIRLGIARAYLELNDLDGALEHLAAAQALWPRALVPGLLLGEVYYRKGYRERAERRLERLAALSEFPQQVVRGIVETYHELEDYAKSLAWAQQLDDEFTRTLKLADMLRHLGRLDEARDAAEEAVRLAPGSADAYNILGIIHRQQGKPELAIEAYHKSIELDPDDSAVRANLGNVLLEKGLLEKAVAAYRDALRIDPLDVRARHNLAMALSEAGREEEAIGEFHGLLEAEPREADSHAMLAQTLQKAGRTDDALIHLQIALRMEPEHAGYHDLLASLLQDQGEMDRAVEEYRKAIALDPENHAYHEHLGSTLSRQGKVEEALQEYSQASELDPDCARAVHGRGVVLATHGRHEEALEAFHAALKLDPEFAEAHSSLGIVLLDLGRAKEALEAHQRAMDLDPESATVQSNLGSTLVALGRPRDAIEVFRKAVALDERDAGCVYNLGVALEEAGFQEEALARFDEALGLDPCLEEALIRLGNARLAEDNLEGAALHYGKAIECDSRSSMGHHNLGLVFKKQGKVKEALPHYRKAVELDPTNPAAHNDLALLLEELGRTREAEEVFRAGMKADPAFLKPYNNLGNLLADQGKIQEAIELYEKALAIDPTYIPARNNLGLALEQEERLDEAIRAFQKTLELEPGYLKGRINLVSALEDAGRLEEALACCREGVALCRRLAAADPANPPRAPGEADFQARLIPLLKALGRMEELRETMERALSLLRRNAERPGASPGDLNSYAWELLTCEPRELRDPELALRFAKEAVEKSGGRDADILDTLALALFETGEVARAVQVQEQAVRLAPSRKTFHEALGRYQAALEQLEDPAPVGDRAGPR